MDMLNFTPNHKKGQHLTREERYYILVRLKGKSIDDYSAEDILFFSDTINGLPRKILNYHTPEELFETQLDRIYAT